jgi:hypothetical protein
VSHLIRKLASALARVYSHLLGDEELDRFAAAESQTVRAEEVEGKIPHG